MILRALNRNGARRRRATEAGAHAYVTKPAELEELLDVSSPDAEGLFFSPVARCASLHRASSLGDLRAVLEQRLDGHASALTLDLSWWPS